MDTTSKKVTAAKEASVEISTLDTKLKNSIISSLAASLDENREILKAANNKDMLNCVDMSDSLKKRLLFDDVKIDELIIGLKELSALQDPIGKTLLARQLDENLNLYKVTCPIGVIGVIFESRPDALIQISSLCLKSGNCVILKGGAEAKYTNEALFMLLKKISDEKNIDPDWIQLLETRHDVHEILAMEDQIDLIIPRGSNKFVKYIMENTKIPVIGHSDGICHIYVDEEADIDMALKVVYDAKCQYPAVCNAVETLLVNKAITFEFLPKLKELFDSENVKMLGDKETVNTIDIGKATEKDWSTEYNDLVISIKVVDDVDEAIYHINKYGSRHTDAIITKNDDIAKKFIQRVDSADVFCNCSTRFADGYRFGLGAEVGISTSKIHARGPVGLEGLVIYKWILLGSGDIVADYSGQQPKKQFQHKNLDNEYPLK